MRQMVGHVVNSMMTHISLPAILERVMHDPGYCDGNFAQIKHLLKGELLGPCVFVLSLVCVFT